MNDSKFLDQFAHAWLTMVSIAALLFLLGVLLALFGWWLLLSIPALITLWAVIRLATRRKDQITLIIKNNE